MLRLRLAFKILGIFSRLMGGSKIGGTLVVGDTSSLAVGKDKLWWFPIFLLGLFSAAGKGNYL